MSHWIFLVNLVAFSSGIAALLVFFALYLRARSKLFGAYLFLFFCLLFISLMSLVDLYLEANLPGIRPVMRRGYFYTMAMVVGLFWVASLRLYGEVFRRSRLWQKAGKLVLVLCLALIAHDVFAPGVAAVPEYVLVFLQTMAALCGLLVLIVALTPGWHFRTIKDARLRGYLILFFLLATLLIALYAVKVIAADTSDFFRVLGRVHFGVFFIVHNTCAGYIAFTRLRAPVAAAETGPGEAFATRFGLTPRELVIVREIVAGKSNREIARAINVAEGTVKIFAHNIFKKTGVSSRMALSALARRRD